MRVIKKIKHLVSKKTAKKSLVEDPLKRERIAKKAGAKTIQFTKRTVIHPTKTVAKAAAKTTAKQSVKVAKSTARHSFKAAKATAHHTARAARYAHSKTAKPLHEYLVIKFVWYDRWHKFKYHKHVHAIIAGFYIIVIASMLFGAYQRTFAVSDLTNSWDWTTPSDYTLSSGLEVSGTSVRLKAQEYADDANTVALFHLNESSGTTVSDSSSNSNTGTATNSPSWVSARLNNGLSLDGYGQSINVADSNSLDFTQKNTLEANIKPTSTFSAGSSTNDMSIIDKGDYKLVLDKNTGKLTYALGNSSYSWTSKLGGGLPASTTVPNQVAAMTTSGTDTYVALKSSDYTGNVVYKLSGGTWTKLGTTAGLPDGYSAGGLKGVSALYVSGTKLYAVTSFAFGFYYHYVYSCDLNSGCASWAQNNLITSSGTTVLGGTDYNNKKVVVIGSNAYIAGDSNKIYVCALAGGNCTNFTINQNYDTVNAIVSDGTGIFAGMGGGSQDADLFYCTTGGSCTHTAGNTASGGNGGGSSGTTAVNTSSWGNGYESINTLSIMGSDLYVGLGSTNNDGQIWKCTNYATNCASLTNTGFSQIGGVGASPSGFTASNVNSITNDGTSLYVSVDGTGTIYKFSAGSWSTLKTYTTAGTPSLYYGNSTLFQGSTFLGSNPTVNTEGKNAEVNSINRTTGTATIVGGHKINSSWQGTDYTGTQFITEYNGVMYAVVRGTSATDSQNYESGIFKIENCASSCTWTQVGGNYISGTFGLVSEYFNLFVYGGKVCSTMQMATGNYEIWCYNGTTWNQLATNANIGTTSAVRYTASIYKGDLYINGASASVAPVVKKYNGTTWSTATTTDAADRYSSMAVMSGKLYLLVNSGYYTYDGTSWSTRGTLTNTATNMNWAITVGDKIYYPCNSNGICTLTSAGTTALDGTLASYCGSDISQVAYFNGKIFVTCSTTGYGAYVTTANSYDVASQTSTSVTGSWSGTTTISAALYANSYSIWMGAYSATSNVTYFSNREMTKLQSTTTSWTGGSWYHIAATYDGENLKLYVNGILESSLAATKTVPTNTQKVYIGRSYGGYNRQVNEARFAGIIDEVRLSNIARTSFNTTPYESTTQTATLNTPVRTSGVWHWDNWTDSETANGGTIKYRLSNDGGTTWLYWGGGSWDVSSSTTQANDVATINTNIATLPVTFSGLKWQAVLKGDGNQLVTLNSVGAQATSDVTAPATNASNITALKAAGGSTLSSGAWTNGSSPYFSWDAGTDAESGVKGYCLYLGTDNTADPVTTKGLLGTAPLDTGGNCQFGVSGTNIDLATAGYIATAMTSSNSPYYFTIKTIDNAGNVSASSTQFNFKFDNTAPTNPAFISAPSGFVASKDVTMTWPNSGGNAAADANSGVVGLQYKIGSSTWYGDSHTGTQDINDLLTDDGSYTTVDPTDYNNLADGINTVYFRTWDQAGNVSTSYVTAAIKLNSSGFPTEPQNLAASPTTNTSNSFAFSWTAPATYNGSDTNIVYCYTFNTLPSAGTCTWTQPGVLSLAAGPYATQTGTNTIYIVAKDETGGINYSTYASTTFTANTTAPGIPLNTAVADVSIRSTSNWRLAITWEEPTSVGSGVSSYKIYRSTDGSTYSQVGSSSSASYVDGSLSQILYYYKVKACDSTNNCGAFSNVSSNTPTGKYTTAASQTAAPSVSNITTRKATIKWSTDRDSDSRIAYGTSSGKYGTAEIAVSTQTTSHTVNLDNLSAGTTYYFKAKWTDVDGNTGISSEYTFRTDDAPSLKEVTTKNVTTSNAIVQFTSKSATKVSILYGKTDAFGAVKTINTAQTESTYTVDLSGLVDGSKYYYKLVSYDNEGNSYDGNIFAFSTPAQPHISNLRFQPIKGLPTSTQKVTWNTNVPSSSIVTYGIDGTEGEGKENPKLVTEHEVIISNLKDDSKYFLIASSKDANGLVATSDKQIFKTGLDTRPPKISDITIETSVRGSGADARSQIVVSWHTDEPATSQVGYTEGSGATDFRNRTAEDSSLSTEHIVIVSGLPTSRVYTVAPISEDSAKNQSIGESQSAIIGRASDSVLTIVLNTLKKVFGF